MEEAKYLFVSLDLCDSTSLKRRLPFWPSIIFKFYNSVEIARTEATKHWPTYSVEFLVWKAIGDEILLYTRVIDDLDIRKSLNTVLVMKSLVDRSMDSYLSAIEQIEGEPPITVPRQHVKVSVWTAMTTTRSPSSTYDLQELSHGNLKVKVFGSDDFIGPDIDYGFRISNFATRTDIAISSEGANVALAIMSEGGPELFNYYEVKKI